MGVASDLRQSVLQAAMQGKLTTQKAEDGDAKDLLLAIRAEKEKLVKEKKSKKEKPLAPITDEKIPFDIPENWVWCRLGDLGNYKKGPFGSALTKSKFVNKGIDTIKVYEQKNVIKKNKNIGSYYITKEYFDAKMQGFEVHSGDILVSCAGTIGETYILPEDIEQGIINQALMRIRLSELVYAPYFLLYFDYVLKENAKADSNGSAIKNIPPFNILKKYAFALPPLPEQQRIVARVEALMKEIEELEQTEKELEAIKAAFSADMKASLLQAAMQGKLTTQKAEDGDAKDLLLAIRKEKKKLVKEKKGKREKPLAPITDEEIPFDIPENWVWCRLGEVGIFVRGNGIKRNEIVESSDYPCIRYGELYTTYHLKTNKVHSRTSKDVFEKAQKAHYGDILMALTGENNKDIALAVAYLGTNEVAYGGDMTVFHHHMEPMYLSYVINSFYFIKIKSNLAKGNIIVHISNDKLSTIPIPLPPLAEQHRIVEKLDQLLPLCDSLSEH